MSVIRGYKPAWQATSAWFSDDRRRKDLAEVLSKSGVEAVADKTQERDVVGTVDLPLREALALYTP